MKFFNMEAERCSPIEATGTQGFCYECQVHLPIEELQESACCACGGRKCKALHGGQCLTKCPTCTTGFLCIDCHSHGLCCVNKTDIDN